MRTHIHIRRRFAAEIIERVEHGDIRQGARGDVRFMVRILRSEFILLFAVRTAKEDVGWEGGGP